MLDEEEPESTNLSDGKDFVFIFIVDRSGSMYGERIQTAKEALKLFMKSLPLKSRFSIISFGSKHAYMLINKMRVIEYNDLNAREAINQIETFDSDFGGTDILEPLKDA